MSHVWILVANSTTAKILEAENNNNLKEIAFLEHPESRMHARDLVSDRQGRGIESALPMRHAMEAQTSPKKLEFIQFAKYLSNHLQEANKQGRFKKIYIAASPQFLGLLRQEISGAISNLIASEIDKDMTQMSLQEVRKHLPLVL